MSFLLRIATATAIMAGLLLWGVGALDTWLSASPLDRAARLAFWIIVGLLVYGAALLIGGLRPAHLKLKHV